MMRRYLGWVALAGLVAACESPIDTNPTAQIDAGTTGDPYRPIRPLVRRKPTDECEVAAGLQVRAIQIERQAMVNRVNPKIPVRS